ncbi:MAG: DUF4375 domain-containing protein [Tabrizicola sp.]
MRFLGIVVALVVAGPANAGPCAPGATVDYPLSAVLADEAIGYWVEAVRRTDILSNPDLLPERSLRRAADYPVMMQEKTAALPTPLADLPYLILLAGQARYPDPLYGLTYTEESTVLPEIIAVAERQGLTDVANALRVPMTLYPDWSAGPEARSQILLAQGLKGLAGSAMRTAAALLHAAAPRIEARAMDLIASDAGLAASYEARRQAVDAERRVEYLLGRLISDCLAEWWTPDEADAAFAGMGQAQADILLLHFFLAESWNGSTHQYLWNSSGTMAPQLAALLDRIGLPDHAAGVRQGMAVFPAPYPRDTDVRREIMATFSEAQNDTLYAVTVWADDGMILEAMARLAEESGLMPR